MFLILLPLWLLLSLVQPCRHVSNLGLGCVAFECGRRGHVQRERNVNNAQGDEDDIAQHFDSLMVALWNTKDWCHFRPTPHCMRHEEEDCNHVDKRPDGLLEDPELKLVDVPHAC